MDGLGDDMMTQQMVRSEGEDASERTSYHSETNTQEGE